MIPLLRSVLRRSFDGQAWHGPSLSEALTGIDARTALERPVAGGHTIWELTHHVMAWTREVARRLDGAPAALPREGDWPEPFLEPDPAARDAAWASLRAELVGARDALLAAVAVFPEARLGERVGTSDDPAVGGQASFGGMLIGLAEHTAYHGGQIVLLRRAIAGLPACSPHPATEREPAAPASPDAETISES
jgi:uncharacterized damage-inducible protein DinB